MDNRKFTNSNQLKSNRPRSKVKFTDELILSDSIKYNDVDEVRTILRRASLNLNLNKINDSGLTALHQAVIENSLELVILLIDSRANVNSLNEDGWTPLHLAASLGYYEIAKYLLSKGADPTILNYYNEAPIDLADSNDFQMVSLLLNDSKLDESNGVLNDDDSEYYNYSDIYKNTDDISSNLSLSFGTSDEYHNKKMLSILQNETNNQNIMEEIMKMYNTNFIQSKKFIRALTFGIYKSCIEANSNQEVIFDQSDFIYKLNVLRKYLDKNYELEYESICTIYTLIENVANSGLLVKRIFTIMYETKTISKEAFGIWKNKDKCHNKTSIVSCLKNFLSF